MAVGERVRDNASEIDAVLSRRDTRRASAPPRKRRRGLLSLAGATLALIAIGLGALWSTTPVGVSLGARLHARMLAVHARSVPLGSIARPMQHAVIATEDEHFYQHAGVDVLGLLRAIPYDLSHGTAAQGASTITEQLAKELYLGGNDHSPLRKLEDIVLALKLEQHYSKHQILSAYLNATYFGAGAYGIGAASERYFGIAPAELDVARASLLAGVIQAPSALDPFNHPHAARVRQVEVLRSLVRNSYITAAAARRAAREPLRLTSGQVLMPVGGHVELAPGPTFDWREFGLGVVLLVSAGVGAALALRRFPRVVVAVPALVLALLGVWALVRSFRVG